MGRWFCLFFCNPPSPLVRGGGLGRQMGLITPPVTSACTTHHTHIPALPAHLTLQVYLAHSPLLCGVCWRGSSASCYIRSNTDQTTRAQHTQPDLPQPRSLTQIRSPMGDTGSGCPGTASEQCGQSSQPALLSHRHSAHIIFPRSTDLMALKERRRRWWG